VTLPNVFIKTKFTGTAALPGLKTAIEGNIKPAGSAAGAQVLDSFYGYVIDLMVRTNAANSSLLLQTEDPSWLYSVRQGATTVWERWNSYTVERGFGDVGMNSFNHYAYGAVAEWMFGSMAGIRPDPARPGFEHFILAPKPDNRTPAQIPEGQTPIRRVKAHYDTTYGRIESAWEYADGVLQCRFTVPQSCSASVVFPVGADAERITLNGISLDAQTLGATREADGWHFEIGAGEYSISSN
jgi:alpha-L-rhamnosidase